MKAKKSIQQLHSMSEFGVVSDLTNLIRVNRLKDRLHPQVPFPHKHDFFQLLIIIRGKGWHEIDFKRHPVNTGHVFAMKPVQVHSWILDPKTEGFVIEFNTASAFSKHELPDFLKIKPENQKRIFSIADGMFEDFMSRAPDLETALQAALALLLTLLNRERREKEKSAEENDALFIRFQKLVEMHFRKHHEVNFYADVLKIPVKVFTMRMKRLSGESARDLIQARCLLESKRLLAYSTLTVREIAYALGFKDPNYFARFFKSKTTCTPGEFREDTRAHR